MINKLQNILTHPAALALPVAVMIILLLPKGFGRFIIKPISSGWVENTKTISFCDLDGDGNSEKIVYNKLKEDKQFFTVYKDEKIVDQWNFGGVIRLSNNLLYCDYDNDGLKEIFVFTVENDSILFYCIKPFDKGTSFFYKKFIFSKVGRYYGNYNVGIQFCDFPDVNDDGYKEVVASVYAGHTLSPRNLFLIDIANDTVVVSPGSGTAIINTVAFDINADGYNEYMGESGAYGNWHKEVPYKDDRAWLMVVDKDMRFLFEPLPFGQYKSNLINIPFKPEKDVFIVSLLKHCGIEPIEWKLMKFDIKGNKLSERPLTKKEESRETFIFSPNAQRDKLFLVSENGLIEKLNQNLDVDEVFNIPNINTSKPEILDIDLDGRDELLFYEKEKQGFVVLQNDFSCPLEVRLANDSLSSVSFSVIKQKNRSPQLFARCGNKYFTFEYHKNPVYFLKYPVWISIYLAVFALLFLLQKIQAGRIEKKYAARRRIANLQLQAIKNQLNPHFTLNLISSIGTLFYKKDVETAGNIFEKYSNMLRNTIINSDKISVSLKDEISFVKNYLELEKFRYDDKFDFEINIAENVNSNIGVPKMIIHTFVENALKHGIKHLTGKGFIEIHIVAEKGNILIDVIDNGVGREKAKEYELATGYESTGKGLKILDNILKLYTKDKKKRIEYFIEDIIESGEVKGTKVKIIIPENILAGKNEKDVTKREES